ncbi:MAG TPA: alpha-2-macroglobulin family protein [Anaeromyxobacteraceae bacterium]|nr:alpha-2-macroglobulin family protein [Anaeromyxobacteraceae bacterium]
MRLAARLAVLATVTLALAACGKGCGKTSPAGVDLSPLPEPPPLSIAPKALPGAGGELAVVVARPQGPAQGNLRPAVTFSKPIVAMGMVEAGAPPVPITIEPKLEGEWRWLGSATVEFQPKGLVPYATAFKVTVAKGLRALDGAELAEPYTFTFETPRPELQEVQPWAGDRWATPDQVVKLLFNQPVAALEQHVRLLAAGQEWPYAAKEIKVADERRTREGTRRYARLGFEERGLRDEQARYELTPRRPLPLDSEVQVRIDGGLAGAAGPLTMGTDAVRAFRTYGPLRVTGVRACPYSEEACHWGPLAFDASNKIDVATLKGRVTVTPKVELDWENARAHHGGLTVPGGFRPGVTYQVAIEPGVKDVFGQPLERRFAGTVAMRDLDPAFEVGQELALIERAGDGALPASAVNLKALTVRTVPLTPGAMARALDERRAARSFDGGTTRTIPVATGRNVTKTFPIPVRDWLAGSGTSLFAVEVVADEIHPKERWQERRRQQVVIGQVTDLAVHAKLGATSGLVWVTRLSDGKPAAGARLSLYDGEGVEKWTGATDADGIGKVPGLSELVKDPEYHSGVPFALVAARLGDDTGVTLSTWSGGFNPWAFDLRPDWVGREAKELGGVFAERGIYRPGETAHLKGIVRYRRLGKIQSPPAGTPVQLTVTSSRGKKLLDTTAPLTGFGTFAADVALPADVSLGGASVSALAFVDGGRISYEASFRVEEYRAPQFKVDVVASAPALVAGDAVTARVLARYLFGGAMPRAQVRWSVNRETTPFAPPRNDGFAFGSHSWWWDDGEPARSADVAGAGEGETDATGALAVDAGKAEALANRTWTYTVEAEVEDVNRQRLANRASVIVHPAAAYAGLRRPRAGFAEAGKADAVEVVAAAPDGARQEGLALAVAVKRREWKWVKKKLAGGEWSSVNEVVEEQVAACALKSAAQGVPCAFTPATPGLYVAEATVTDAKGRAQTSRLPFYAIGSGWISWQREDTDRLELVADKEKYEPGETARILVKSPWPEAEALLTVEREGVSLARRVRLAGAATTLEVPITEESIPNVFASVVLVRGRVAAPEKGAEEADPGRPAVKVGYVQLAVEKRAKRLSVSVRPDGQEKRPRDKVKVDVEVKDARGRGVPAEVTVWAVDEGILRLTGYQPPDPVELLHPARGLSVRVGESLVHLVERRRYGEKGLGAGGGGGGDGAGAGFRSDFKTTVLFAPEVVTGPDGRASVTIDLPDNLTTFRIMAVAVTRADQAGVGGSEVRVAKPLMALPALPRLARVGDRFEAGVVVHSPTGAVKEVEVRAEAQGLKLDGAPTQKVLLGATGREVRFAFHAEAPGQAVLRFFASGAGERDGVEQRLPVALPVEPEAVAVAGDTRDVRREGLLPPGGIRPDVGGLEVTLASTALGGFAENMRQLVDYPYGCLEQLSSRLVPFVALRELQGRFGLKHEPGEVPAWLDGAMAARFGSRDPDVIVKKTVAAIEQLQNPDGGYRYWPSSGCSSEYASSYAVLALGRAAEVGYPVDRAALARGQRYLAETVAAGRCTRCDATCYPPGDAVRVSALYALARTGAPRASGYGELLARRNGLPLFSKAQLADAMFVGGGDRAQARALLQEIVNTAKESAAEVHFEEVDRLSYAPLWSSDVRTSALVLQTLADVSPDHPFVAKLAAWLGKARKGDGRFGSTQEAAYALMALAEVTRTREREVPDFTAKVTLGGAAVAEVPFKGRSTEVRTVSVPAAKLPAAGQPLPFDFARQGKAGVLYYGALLRYAPAQVPTTPLERGLFVQRWFEPYEGGGQVKAVKAGDLVRVRVRLATNQLRQYVALSVPLPAGLEIVDTSLASTAGQKRTAREEGPRQGYDTESDEDEGATLDEPPAPAWTRGFWSPFVFEERRDDRVLLFADRLPPGIHVASFVARATTPGEWVLTPAHAEEMYSPDVFGRSDGGTFKVVLSPQVAER